jgi:8-oxo-dGTP pyrophosphatase MutT (NUDIX family)
VAFIDHIRVCNAFAADRFLPFVVAGQTVGAVARDLVPRLLEPDGVFEANADGVTMDRHLNDFAARSEAMARVLAALRAEGRIKGWRDEPFRVAADFGAKPLLKMERAGAPLFGVTSYGVHVNGYVRTPQGLSMWIGRRSATKPTYPNMLDNICAGAIAFGMGVRETLIKEAGEEASLPADIAETAKPVSAIRYCCEGDGGLRPDVLFVYDLELPAGFVPKPSDGEISEYMLWPISDVADRVRQTFDFKFNCNLVIIDFLIRHGLMTADDPDYLALVEGLHRSRKIFDNDNSLKQS